LNPQKPHRKPGWLKVKAPLGETYAEVRKILGELSLHTVCQEANCPNRLECWANKTATFLILGDVCTRGCRFCNVRRSVPIELDDTEPERIAAAVSRMNLSYVVITSVTRDDLSDGGASVFAESIRRIREMCHNVSIEVLIPDFHGSVQALDLVLDAVPNVVNHNLETTRRLTPVVRRGADYDRSLKLIERVAESARGIKSKSGLMVGLGEDRRELRRTFSDLSEVSCELLTIGQYLPPSDRHYPLQKYYTPEEFSELRAIAEEYGFESVLAGPLVRSSYHARDQFDSSAQVSSLGR
jgi:lipoic acid synthetase